MNNTLSRRHEFLFLYDIRMGNPNGDPDENRPRRLPDGTFYVTDVRLKRFVRDWLKTQGKTILVDRPEDAATNLTGRLQHFLRDKPEAVKTECEEYEKLLKAEAEKAEAEKKEAAARRARGKKSQGEAATGGAEAAKPTEETEEAKPTDEPEEADTSSPAVQAGRLVVSIILKAFIDARLFGSSFAFKDWEVGGEKHCPKTKDYDGGRPD